MSTFNLEALTCILAPIYLISSFLASYYINQLIRLERTEFREAWGNDGLPRELVWFGSRRTPDFATMLCYLGWLFAAPSWAKSSPQALQLLWRLRLTTLISSIGIIFFFYGYVRIIESAGS
ncbi:MAG TPA: hypothetical protein PKH77_10035 [Anaerolineae bacterium]|nr:hypothetical protein [Anaerolineae bacterium]